MKMTHQLRDIECRDSPQGERHFLFEATLKTTSDSQGEKHNFETEILFSYHAKDSKWQVDDMPEPKETESAHLTEEDHEASPAFGLLNNPMLFNELVDEYQEEMLSQARIYKKKIDDEMLIRPFTDEGKMYIPSLTEDGQTQ